MHYKLFVVTVKLPKNPDHDPKNKKTGPCKYSSHCTDVTGEHHSFLLTAETEEAIRSQFENEHITRIEQVG